MEKSFRELSKKFWPEFSFIQVHYIYIAVCTIIGSILIYPVRNLRYIDALFFSAGACTQGGLNTVDLSAITLWQQLVLYFLPFITNPIFINSFVVLLRLYWFEKRIDNVNVKSKLQSRIRRSATLQQQALNPSLSFRDKAKNWFFACIRSRDTVQNGHGQHQPPQQQQQQYPSALSSNNTPATSNIAAPQHSSQVLTSINSVDAMDGTAPPPLATRDIKFADTPVKANKVRKNSIDPVDIAKSITMLEKSHKEIKASETTISEKESIEPVLVISGRSSIDTDTDSIHTEFSGNYRHGYIESEKLKHGSKVRPNNRLQHFGKKAKRTLSFEKMPSDIKHPQGEHKLLRTTTSYLSWQPTVGGNSVFVGLNEEQREELGGVEYRALKLLYKILIAYMVLFHLLSAVMLVGWAVGTKAHDTFYSEAGTNATWWGFFTAASSFHDLGYTLTPNSMMSFSTATYPLIVMSFFIVIGNTGFPCLLHFIIWVMLKLASRSGRTHESLQFLLDHPRRCFTLLLPSRPTWWLFIVLLAFNLIDLILFLILDLHGEAVQSLPYGSRVLAGLFQAICTRTAGFSVLNVSLLHVSVQVSYIVMMYVSVFPIALSVRHTNVYEEQSIGVYVDPEHIDEQTPSYIATLLRRQLSHDLWFIFLAFFIITVAEGKHFSRSDPDFTPFAVLFEVVSAYGTVGLSLGYPTTNTSLSGKFSTVSKLVIIALLYRGRHRGLPYSVDRAIMLPSEKLDKRDIAQEHRVLTAREHSFNNSRSNNMDNSGADGTGLGHIASRASGVKPSNSTTHMRSVLVET